MYLLYVYLANRNKKGVKLLTTLKSETPVHSKLIDLTSLNLTQTKQAELEELIQKDSMHFEAWVETAKSYAELKEKLKERGYADIPMGPTSLLKTSGYGSKPVAKIKSVGSPSTMLRRKIK